VTDDIRTLTARVAEEPSSLAFLELGEALRRRGQLEAAHKVARGGLARYPALADAHDLVARILGDQGDLAGAFDAWVEALRLDPMRSERRKASRSCTSGPATCLLLWGTFSGPRRSTLMMDLSSRPLPGSGRRRRRSRRTGWGTPRETATSPIRRRFRIPRPAPKSAREHSGPSPILEITGRCWSMPTACG